MQPSLHHDTIPTLIRKVIRVMTYDQTTESVRLSVRLQILERYADLFPPQQHRTRESIKAYVAVAKSYLKKGGLA